MTTSAELAAHPMCQLARVLTWGALGLLAYGVINWVAGQPWFALHTIEVKTPMAHVTEAGLSRNPVDGAIGQQDRKSVV